MYLGFMGREEMKKYLVDKVKLDNDLADKIWEKLGGDLYYCHRFLDNYDYFGNKEDFEEYLNMKVKYTVQDITPTSFGLPPIGHTIPNEHQDILRKIYVELSESDKQRDQKLVEYESACKKYGVEIIQDLILSGALYYIKGKYLSEDRTIDPEMPVLIANRPIDQLAIDRYVERKGLSKN